MAVRIQHNAPAGKKYASIRDAGEQTLATYCDRYPQSHDRLSFIIPVLFQTNHPENVEEHPIGLSAADQNDHTGLKINIRGERGEYEVYKAFYSLVRSSPIESILVLFGYDLDNKNGQHLKEHAITKELPGINLSRVNMRREHDFIVFVRYLGVVLCEGKSSASPQNMAIAEAQLRNSETFVK